MTSGVWQAKSLVNISRVGRMVGGQRSLLQCDRRSSPQISKAAVYISMEARFRPGEVISDFRYRLQILVG